MTHASVLLQEAIDGLAIEPGDIFVDCTLGNGGHAEEVARRFGSEVHIIGIDMDADALDRSRERLARIGAKVDFVQGNFRNIDSLLAGLGLASADKILFDLGLSSNQLEESGRGFSFQKDEPLIMTFSKGDAEINASIVVNEWSQETLETIIRGFGEERYAGRIARGIVEARQEKTIRTTGDLVNIISSVIPSIYRKQKTHFATRTFQAIRIAVNEELTAISEGLKKAFDMLSPKGRIAVISFHSLEDRIVKKYFKEKSVEGKGLILTKKPLMAGEEERKKNPRSRSAKLRLIEKKQNE